MTTWALPENIEDVLPRQALRLERMRRIVLDQFQQHGYMLVMPPMLEYVESLLSGVGHDMDLATFKLVDQLSGRMMGLRADTTPQVARIDAHVLNRRGVTRLCYVGSVLHTRPAGLGKSRELLQAGAELYGHAGLDADIEVQQLMLETLRAIGLTDIKLDIGHSSIFRVLVEAAGLTPTAREAAFAAVTAKDVPYLNAQAGDDIHRRALAALPTLYGAAASDVFTCARAALPAHPRIVEAITELETVAAHFAAQSIAVSVDFSELGGFDYESGIAFAAYASGASEAIARGGRYDDIGHVFGRARPATGFSMDLKSLLPLIPPLQDAVAAEAIIVSAASELPPLAASSLPAAVAALRAKGEIVIVPLAGEMVSAEDGASRYLRFIDDQWQVVKSAVQ
jgi:ATP phosphoribosyltransferase regulatory subunit